LPLTRGRQRQQAVRQVAHQVHRPRRLLDQPRQLALGCAVEAGVHQLAQRGFLVRVGRLAAVFPTRKGGLRDPQQLARVLLLDAAKQAPAAQRRAQLARVTAVDGRGGWMHRGRAVD
jgi:hypothetical protein